MPVDAIRGVVLTVRQNSTYSFLEKARPRAVSHYVICEGTEELENELYYVSWDFVHCSDKFYVGDRKKPL